MDIVRVENVELPGDRTTLGGLSDTVGPDEGEMVAVRDRLPDNPLMLVMVMLEFEDPPGDTEMEVGVAEIAKSTTWTVTWIVCESEPLVAVMVTV